MKKKVKPFQIAVYIVFTFITLKAQAYNEISFPRFEAFEALEVKCGFPPPNRTQGTIPEIPKEGVPSILTITLKDIAIQGKKKKIIKVKSSHQICYQIENAYKHAGKIISLYHSNFNSGENIVYGVELKNPDLEKDENKANPLPRKFIDLKYLGLKDITVGRGYLTPYVNVELLSVECDEIEDKYFHPNQVSKVFLSTASDEPMGVSKNACRYFEEIKKRQETLSFYAVMLDTEVLGPFLRYSILFPDKNDNLKFVY